MRTISIDISENRQACYRRSCAFTIADLTLEMRVPDTVSDTEMANRFRSSPPFDDCREVDHHRYKEDMQIIHLSAFSPFNRTRCVPSVAVWSLR